MDEVPLRKGAKCIYAELRQVQARIVEAVQSAPDLPAIKVLPAAAAGPDVAGMG